MTGIINLDKPSGISSARAVARVKRLLPRGTRIGHAGTLDPFATGVLLLLVGRATKQCERLMSQAKQYEATIKLGATTATLDPESPEEPFSPSYDAGVRPPLSNESVDQLGRDSQDSVTVREHPGAAEVRAVLARFVGAISQRPPAFSALKVSGQRAYKLARAGKPVELQPRPVRVDALELLDYAWPLLRLRIDCGRGFYVRSLARDVGEALNVGGYLTALRRTRIGQFTAAHAVKLEQLESDGPGMYLSDEIWDS